jgi:hypothetical protein
MKIEEMLRSLAQRRRLRRVSLRHFLPIIPKFDIRGIVLSSAILLGIADNTKMAGK